MYYEIYIDRLFCLNLWLNSLILYLTAYILKCQFHHFRLLLSAVGLSALDSAVVCLVQFTSGFSLLFLQFALCMLGTFFAFPFHGMRDFLRRFFLLQMLSFCFGGILEWLLSILNMGKRNHFEFMHVIVISGIAYGLLKTFADGIKRRKQIDPQIYLVTVHAGEKSLSVRALLDTGNGLREPLSGKPVSILEKTAAEKLRGQKEGILLIPYRAVGTRSGILYGFTADSMILVCGEEQQEILQPVIGITEEKVSIRQEYEMLLSPFLFC